jgi:general secretion pathway protein I
LNRLFELHDIHLVIPWLDSIRRAVLQEDMSGMLKILGSFRRQAVKVGGYGQGLCFGSGPFMPTRSRESGFTLIEVLVALAIIAVAMSAAVRVAGLMTQSSGLLRDRSIAMLAAQSRMAELRLEGRLPLGMKATECDQGRLLLRCEQVIGAAQNGRLLRVGIQVVDRSQDAPPLARLETLLSRTESP